MWSMMRRYYPYHQQEEFQGDGGMWKMVSGPMRQIYIEASAGLMRDPINFERAMLGALREWPVSCAVNLATPGKNRRAWIGHAGCFLATGSPEECTRMGWHTLAPMEQRKANLAADNVIKLWRRGGDARQLKLGEAVSA